MNPGPLLNIRNTFPLYLLAVLFSPLINFENTKIYLLSYLHLSTFICHHHHHLHFYFAITTIIFIFICFAFSYLFCFLESLAKLARTCDTLAGKQGSLFFLLHVGSILTYSNLCYFDPVLLQAIICNQNQKPKKKFIYCF